MCLDDVENNRPYRVTLDCVLESRLVVERRPSSRVGSGEERQYQGRTFGVPTGTEVEEGRSRPGVEEGDDGAGSRGRGLGPGPVQKWVLPGIPLERLRTERRS